MPFKKLIHSLQTCPRNRGKTTLMLKNVVQPIYNGINKKYGLKGQPK